MQEEARIAIEEARMVLPGIQALFGFQLIAVFSDRFEALQTLERAAHLVSILLIVLTITLIMTPAAYHRIAGRGEISRYLLDITSGFLAAAMCSFMLGISIEIYLVALLITEASWLSAVCAGFSLALCASYWFYFPLRRRRRSRQ